MSSITFWVGTEGCWKTSGACKRYMCVNLKLGNDAVFGDCGRCPMCIEGMKRSMAYWLKILKLRDRYVRKCYNMMKHYVWPDGLLELGRKLLHTNGFGYLWEQQEVPHDKKFLSLFKQRLQYQYHIPIFAMLVQWYKFKF